MSFSPLSTGVLGAATVVSSPALWQSLVDHSMPLDVALTRYLVAVVLCWAALSLVATWAFPDPRPVEVEADRRGATPVEEPEELQDH